MIQSLCFGLAPQTAIFIVSVLMLRLAGSLGLKTGTLCAHGLFNMVKIVFTVLNSHMKLVVKSHCSQEVTKKTPIFNCDEQLKK